MMKKINEWFKKTDKFDLAGYVLLLVFSVFLFSYLYNNIAYITDSDQSSNLIYAKLLLEEGSIVSKNWYFSTYVDIVNMDKIQAFFFLFTDNWLLVHWLTNVAIEILLFLSFFYVCKQLNIKHISWISFLVIGSVNYLYYKFAFSFNIYALYMILGLFSFGLTVNTIKTKKPAIFYGLLLFTVFLFSTSGIRNITTIYAPVIVMVFILLILNKLKFYDIEPLLIKRLLAVLLITVLGSISGYLFNKFVLCASVGYESTTLGITRELLKEIPTIFNDVLWGWLNLFGIGSKDIISLFFAVLLIVLVVWCAVTLFKRDKDRLFDQILIIYFIMSACAISVTFFISSSFSFETRYLLQSFIFLIVVLGCMLSRIDIKWTFAVCVLIAVCATVRTYNFVEIEKRVSTNQELIDICDILDEKEIYQGYGAFWNANVLTELSDGKIEVWAYADESYIIDAIVNEDYKEFDNGLKNEYIFKWLQKKDHDNTAPEGKFFIVLEKYYDNEFSLDTIDKYTVYQGGKRRLLIFENFDEFVELFAVE